MKDTRNLVCVGVLCVALLTPGLASARYVDEERVVSKHGDRGPKRIFVLDGSNVHNVGELQMHVGNWGQFGSWPGSGFAFANAPSAQWPAGSGTEYLFVAGLWVGALKNTVAAVSTAAYQFEFRPTQDLRDIMYRSAEGTRGGNRLPSPTVDDDRDGERDEDWLNGYDDDEDGNIDEDYAAISKQMFVCQYYDNTEQASQIYPQHNPLNLHVRQESYQWEEDRFDDFVGANFWITNVGTDVLEEVYIGFFADGDAGMRSTENYWEDDASGFLSIRSKCTNLGPVSMDIAYTYDVDGDEGETLGYFGIMFLGHTTDPTGEAAPPRVAISTYANFSGQASYEDGGDPTDDFERYELLSSNRIKRDATAGRDYRMLMCAGPFNELLPGSTLVFQTAFVIGERRFGLIENAADAQLTFNGAWFNLDGNASTGIGGRETPVYGPATNVVIDSCAAGGGLIVPINWNSREPLYINGDCDAERDARLACGYGDADSTKYMTGIAGQETQINWIVGTAPPPPELRVDGDAIDGVVVYWDSFSESVPDVKTQVFDFEGYRVWRADDWARPLGTSSVNGPARDLWRLLYEMDVVNAFGEDTGLDGFRYEPLQGEIDAARKRDILNSLKAYLLEYPGGTPPCPQGVTLEACDTLTAMAMAELGLPDGRSYYRYVDRLLHRGRPYFYSVTATDHGFTQDGDLIPGKAGDPSSSFIFIEPGTPSQPAYNYSADNVYVVPNPATTESMQPWTLSPNNDDPTGIKVEFRNLPADRGTIRVYTLAGDLVVELPFDGLAGAGTVRWPLVSRNGQDITSGVYLFSVDTESGNFKRKVGKFVVIR
jgi:hypothetical protein